MARLAVTLALVAMLFGCAAAQDRFAAQDPITGLKGGKAAVGSAGSVVGVWKDTVTQDSIDLIIKKDTKGKFLQALGISAPVDNAFNDAGLTFTTTGLNTDVPVPPALPADIATIKTFICDSRFKGRALLIGSGNPGPVPVVGGIPANYLVQVYKKGSGATAAYFLAGTQLDADLSDTNGEVFLLQLDAATSGAATATKFPTTAASECGFLSI